MTTGPGTGRVSTSETTRGLLAIMAAQAQRQPSPPEHSTELTTTTIRPAGEKAYRVHNWSIVVRGPDADENQRIAHRLDAENNAKYAHELEAPDNLGAALAASVVAQQDKKP